MIRFDRNCAAQWHEKLRYMATDSGADKDRAAERAYDFMGDMFGTGRNFNNTVWKITLKRPTHYGVVAMWHTADYVDAGTGFYEFKLRNKKYPLVYKWPVDIVQSIKIVKAPGSDE